MIRNQHLRWLLILTLALGLMPMIPAAGAPGNILLIIADDLGTDASAQYADGSEKPATPTLNQLANQGLIFDNLWVNPACTPTRATLLTGKYGIRTQVLEVGDPLSLQESSLHNAIAASSVAQYATAVIGKWHVAGSGADTNLNQPADFGVDYYAGIYNGGVRDYYNWTLTSQGTQTEVVNEYATTKLTDLSIAWIDQQQAPWFLWLAYNAPHTPFHLPPDGLYTTDVSGGDPTSNPLPLYLAAIEAMDHEIQRLLDSLTPVERANTTIIFIGDNGTPRNVYQGAGTAKGSLGQGGVGVPMFVSGLGVSRAGQRESALANGVDLFNTISALAGATGANTKDGVNLLPLFSSTLPGPRDFAYSEGGNGGPDEWTVRDQRYKLVTRSDFSQELYDLASDPDETENLLATAPNDELVIAALATLNAAGLGVRGSVPLFADGFE